MPKFLTGHYPLHLSAGKVCSIGFFHLRNDSHLHRRSALNDETMLIYCLINPLYSLKSLFDSSEFKENLSAFPQLVAEGFSSGSFSGEKVEDCCKTLKKLTLFSLMKRKEVESYHTLGV